MYKKLGPSAARFSFAGSLLEPRLAVSMGGKNARKILHSGAERCAGAFCRVTFGALVGGSVWVARMHEEAISDHFWTQRGKCLQEASRKLFRSISGGSAGNAPRRFPGSHVGAFLRQRGKCPQEASLPPLNRPRMLCLRVFGDHKAEKNAPPPSETIK